MSSTCFKITVNVPPEFADKVRKAMGDAGAGKLGEYTHCSFSVRGTGRYIPQEGAHPFKGEANKFEETEEEKIETWCAKDDLQNVLQAIKKSHPYEEPAISYWEVNLV